MKRTLPLAVIALLVVSTVGTSGRTLAGNDPAPSYMNQISVVVHGHVTLFGNGVSKQVSLDPKNLVSTGEGADVYPNLPLVDLTTATSCKAMSGYDLPMAVSFSVAAPRIIVTFASPLGKGDQAKCFLELLYKPV
jgi:hypothetical protein